MSFENKVVLIVNGELDIGYLAAEYFIAEKAKLAVASTNDDRECKNLLQKIKECGIEMDAFVVINDSDSKRIIDKTIETFGRLDVLFINAFFAMPASIENLSMRDFDAVLAKNIRNPIELTHFAVPHLSKARGNVIINNSSALGLIPLENWIYYSISKAALHQFVRCAALELKSRAVRINSISPEGIDTEFHSFIDLERDKEEEEFRIFLEQNNIKGPMNVQKIGCKSAISFLAKDDNSLFITGIIVPIHGSDDDTSTRGI